MKTKKLFNSITFRAIAVIVCALMFATIAQPLSDVFAVTSRLSTRSQKIWLNGKGTVTFTLKNRTADETIKVKAADKSLVKVKVGKWKGDNVNVAFTPKADGQTTVTVKCGEESMKLTLIMRKKAAMTAEEIYTYTYDSAVEIKTWDSSGNVYIGAGFFIGEGQVITAYHVVSSASKMTITDYRGKEYAIKSVADYSEDRDLIVFNTEATNTSALTIATDIVGGEKMYAFGSPAGVTATFSTGVVSNPFVNLDGGVFFQSTMPAGIGSGGGPMVNQYGEVLGIMSLTVSAAQNLNFGIRYNIVKYFMDNLASSPVMTMTEFYEKNAGKIKETNDYDVFGKKSSIVDRSSAYDGREELDSTAIYNKAHDAMVDIVVVFEDGNGSSGSGFFIDSETIVTCAHVVSHGRIAYIKVTDYNENEYEVTGGPSMNTEYDVAVLTVDPINRYSTHSSLPLATGYIPCGGETVYAFGSPAGYSATFSEGIAIIPMANLSYNETTGLGIAHDLKFIVFSAPIYSGSSGGVLINKYGEAIGITSGIIKVTENLNLAIQIEQIKKIN